MPLTSSGEYITTSFDRPYEIESSYYLNFQITSALVSIEYITSYQHKDFSIYENKAQYYHYYTDHLLYSMGQISTRFITTKHDSDLDKKRKKSNAENFKFLKEEFPILYNKLPRNTIEHIDEYNNQTIKNLHGGRWI